MKTLISCTLSQEANEIYQQWDRGSKSAKISKLIQFDEQYPNIVKALKTREGHLLGMLAEVRNHLASQMRLNPHLGVHNRTKYEAIIHDIQTETDGTIFHDPTLSSLSLLTTSVLQDN